MSREPIKIAINGFGRIGRSLLRILFKEEHEFQLMLINDIASIETCAYLFEFDSVFGAYQGEVSHTDTHLVVDGISIPFYHHSHLNSLNLSEIDVVLDCTGLPNSAEMAARDLAAGASNVLISGPCDRAQATLVLGANEDKLGNHRIVSNASCTTNALAPLVRALDDEFGVVSGHMTTVHCYTGSQPTVDKPHGDPARSRAAAMSMVPTTTSAQRLTDIVLPHLSGRIEARAIRVPTASVSAIDLTVQTDTPVTPEKVNAHLLGLSETSCVFGYTIKPLVSTDLRARPESLIVSGAETSVSVGGLLRVFGWYDNEWGFSCRMLDMARLMAARD